METPKAPSEGFSTDTIRDGTRSSMSESSMSLEELSGLMDYTRSLQEYWSDVCGFQTEFDFTVTVEMPPEELEGFLDFRKSPMKYDIKSPRGSIAQIKESFKEHPIYKVILIILVCIPPVLISFPFVLYFVLCLLQAAVDETYDLGAALESAYLPKIENQVRIDESSDAEGSDDGTIGAFGSDADDDGISGAKEVAVVHPMLDTLGSVDDVIASMEQSGDVAYIAEIPRQPEMISLNQTSMHMVFVPVDITYVDSSRPPIDVILISNASDSKSLDPEKPTSVSALFGTEWANLLYLSHAISEAEYSYQGGTKWVLFPFWEDNACYWDPVVTLGVRDSSGDIVKTFTYRPQVTDAETLNAIAEEKLAETISRSS